MQHLVFRKKGVLEWEEVPSPKITGKNQALVRPIAIARCDLDIGIVTGRTLFRPPFPLGHEFVGEIISVSDDLSDRFTTKQRVAVSFQISCGTCPSCLAADSKSCTTLPPVTSFGMAPGAQIYGGAVAESVLVPYASQMLLPIKESTNPVAVASLSDNIAEAWKLAGKYLETRPDSKVLVVGGQAASIGLYTALLAHRMGRGTVVYWDTDKARIDLASSLGIPCEYMETYPKSAGKFDLVCECASTKEGWDMAMRSIAPNGVFTSASIFWTNKWEIPYLELYNAGAKLHITRVDSREYMTKILSLVESGIYDPGPIVTKVASFSDAKDAWIEPSTKLVITQSAIN
ncbi:zinc-dependent alcohol dehydrogenase [Leptospira kobayashii]|uniref:zinc-dependent alcohol dehydrogenase n=1 Tax=Leptospira kobayashii TaxID=1917830 RepID=UPI000D59BE5C|nr:alcohol dehydrogenase catalytic domain-containing protein [Leptospira kobayashii]